MDDRTSGYDYQKLLNEELAEYEQVEVTDDLRLGGHHALGGWNYWFEYLVREVWHTSFNAEVIGHPAPPAGPLKVLSLGCGHGGLELDLAATLVGRPYEVHALDLNPKLYAEAASRASVRNLHLTWEQSDLNFLQLPPASFDVIYAHASLHHILNLEHVFAQVNRALRPGGRFVLAEMIGKSAVLFWPENLDLALDVVRHMPDRYKPGVEDVRTIVAPYTQAYVGMEGIRQEEIPGLLTDWFNPVKMFTYGSFIRMICTHPVIGSTFDPDRPDDRFYLEQLFAYDLALIASGQLRATELFGVFEQRNQL
jgi:ubiquinone/menaquinone biosynthesis C-methylase UbiE